MVQVTTELDDDSETSVAKEDEVEEVSKSQTTLPDLEVLRTKVLNKMRVGGQSTAGKTLDLFIKELKRDK